MSRLGWIPSIVCGALLGCGSVSSESTDAGDNNSFDADLTLPDAPPGQADARPFDAAGGSPDARLATLAEQQMAFISDRDGSRDVWLMRLDGTSPSQVTSGADDDLFASITPDGTRVAFARSSDIWTVNVNGTNLQQLTTDTALDTRPAFSPDGTKIAFTSQRDGGNNIYIMNADGSAQTPVTTGSDSKTFGQFNHDGTKITYSNSTDGDVYVINTNGTGNQALFPNIASDSAAAFSRDGSKVVFSSDRSGAWELWVGNADGSGGPTMITTTGNTNPFHASFDYNGTHVIYYANPVGSSNRAVYITDLAGGAGATQRLTTGTGTDQKIGSWVILAP